MASMTARFATYTGTSGGSRANASLKPFSLPSASRSELDPEPGLLQQDPEDHLAFRNETMLAPDEIALADGAVILDPRIVGI